MSDERPATDAAPDAEEQRLRDLRPAYKAVIRPVAFAMSVYQLWIGYFGAPFSYRHRPTHLLFAFVLLFLLHPASRRERARRTVPLYDLVLAGLVVLTTGFTVFSAEEILNRIPYVTPLSPSQLLVGAALILVVLEATRRTIGPPLVVVTAVFILYARAGNYLPSPFWHRGFTWERIIEQAFMTLDGIWGVPLHVTSTYVFLFILFGAFLVSSGAGDFFTDFAYSITGHRIGGPAKTAVVSSSLMGTLSGSSIANVVTTGAFTIPMMKRSGYAPHFAGAVEAVASTGGQIVPPVMGAAAFIMVEFTGIPYVQIMKHAVIPALLFYIALYFMVHIEAKKLRLTTMADKELPRFWSVVLGRGYLFLPIVAIIYLLIEGYTPLKAAFWAIAFLLGLLVLAAIGASLRRGRSLAAALGEVGRASLEALEEGPKLIIPVTTACACAGIIVGIILMTGLGQRMAAIILSVSYGLLPVALVLTMLLAIVLGMGMPSSSAYIIMAALLAPGLVKMGVSVIAAHMFAFYFASMSAITPPVALASYGAAGIARADPIKTGITGFRLGLTAFIVPFMFVYSPSLLFIGEWHVIAGTIVSAAFGVFCLASALQGMLLVRSRPWESALMSLAFVMLLKPGVWTDAVGLACFAAVYLSQKGRAGLAGAEGAGPQEAG